MTTVRQAVVAGTFYPADPKELLSAIHTLLAQSPDDLPQPKAIIAPHAGYIYSGIVAAHAYACLSKAATKIRRVVLLGPAHRYPVQGLAAPAEDYFATPLGQVKIDHAAILQAKIDIIPEAHTLEHSLEVQLPFLQTLLKDFTLVPLVVGAASGKEIATVLETLWNGPATLIVVSSDLSHYHDYETARKMDQAAAKAIVNLDIEALQNEQACGHYPIAGLLEIAAAKGLKAHLIDLRNSGDTAGPKDQVVGYGAFHFIEENHE